MDVQIIEQVAKETSIKLQNAKSIIKLSEEGNTVPFIARYRKELTGAADEVQIREVLDLWNYKLNLKQRKEEVIRIIDEQGKLTMELRASIENASKLQEVEDLYRPYKQKRRTRATIAKEKGLEPLANLMFEGTKDSVLESEAEKYLSEENEISSIEDALQGAKDIVSEMVSDDADNRTWIRDMTIKEGLFQTTIKGEPTEETATFEMYYDYKEPVQKIVPHRVLAANRGEKEDVLKVEIIPNVEKIHNWLTRKYVKNTVECQQLADAVLDGYKRLIQPSIEREVRNGLTEVAEEQAIHIFSENLRNLLLQAPLKGNVVLGYDPGYRTGCKLGVVDETGKVKEIAVIYPTPPKSDIAGSTKTVLSLIKKYNVEIVAIGNGTGSRESEQFIADLISENNLPTSYLIVNEAGASVYSASPLAREEFPDLQVEERSAISIARRIQDPLAELVKIDPKSVGVGQYQHDVSQKKLNDSLTFVVETVVNRVGVNVNTASSSLLQYVSGLSKAVAQNVVKAREEKGKFLSRTELKKIPRLGAKTYEQCIGFLRILDGKQPLDQTPIHPESYSDAKLLLTEIGCDINDIGTDKLKKSLESINVSEVAEKLNIGEPTLKDIIEALIRPGRDPRDEIAKPLLKKDILKLEDLKQGMKLEGTIRNVVDFGAFVDIGVKQDGLVHISKLSDKFVKHPLDVVSVGQIVTVWVDSVDVNKNRVALTMKDPN
jgi:protein Tex